MEPIVPELRYYQNNMEHYSSRAEIHIRIIWNIVPELKYISGEYRT